MIRDNCSHEEAVASIAQYKAKKATNLPNFILKYGEEEGTRRYNDWKTRSLKKGWDAARANGRAQSPRCADFYIRKGYNEADAKKAAIMYQHTNSSLHVGYYTSRGLSEQEAKDAIREIHDQKIGRDSYREYLEATTDLSNDEITEVIRKIRGHFTRSVLGEEAFALRVSKIRKTFEDKGKWIPLAECTEYELYKKEVWSHTNSNDISSLTNHHKRGLAGVEGAYHLDHKFSIFQGFVEGIDPKIIGSYKNLECIPWRENVVKQGKCSIDIKELLNENQENN